MKQQLPATNASPVAFIAASIALALFLFPGGVASVSSSRVAPALKLVAGDVAAAVQGSAPSVAKAQPESVALPSAGVGAAHARTRRPLAHSETRSVPAHRAASHFRGSPKHAVTHPPARVSAAPAPKLIGKPAAHGHGKAKALGHLKKAKALGFWHKGNGVGRRRKGGAPVVVSASKPGHPARANGSQGQVHGRPADVPQWPPAVPSGQAKGDQSAGHGASRGGGK
jgi:hypothetical protein